MGDVKNESLSGNWIDELTDSQCMEIFWLYVDPPEPFLKSYPPALLGQAMRYALREVAANGVDAIGGQRSSS